MSHELLLRPLSPYDTMKPPNTKRHTDLLTSLVRGVPTNLGNLVRGGLSGAWATKGAIPVCDKVNSSTHQKVKGDSTLLKTCCSQSTEQLLPL